MRWDIFCQVIDNYGDVGVCWRLASDLGSRGESVRLFVDDEAALRWMAPGGAAGVRIGRWPAAGSANEEPADVVIEAFGCTLPEKLVTRVAENARAPCWINLEYLSAEGFVERSHGLPSPQLQGPGRGLIKWFFYPGFTPGTGGLLREPGLLDHRATFERDTWLQAQGWPRRADEQVVVLFGYSNSAIPSLLEQLSLRPSLLLLADGPSQHQARALLGPGLKRERLRALTVPRLTQIGFDQLLWCADLNFVRGEDSLVRAIWAGAPFVWQIYPQGDAAHLRKLDAFLDRMLDGVSPPLAHSIRGWFHVWSAVTLGTTSLPERPELAQWRRMVRAWRDQLAMQADLTSQLLRFALDKR